ncbi:MAG TPA: hypothetical protein VFK50_01980 [Sphingomicrobium sp.]|nr:hypothetical protein [Sphingomicrobium sp.]
MRSIFFMTGLFLLSGCAARQVSALADPRLARAERLIDAFYSFDPARLRPELADAPRSAAEILYYQGWAEGGNYQVLERKPCRAENAATVACSIKVRDDLIGALRTGYDVTDTFHMTFADGRIVKVATSSDDPPAMSEAFKWLRARKPQLWTSGPCRGFFAAGPTPQDCVRAVVSGFREYRLANPLPRG